MRLDAVYIGTPNGDGGIACQSEWIAYWHCEVTMHATLPSELTGTDVYCPAPRVSIAND